MAFNAHIYGIRQLAYVRLAKRDRMHDLYIQHNNIMQFENLYTIFSSYRKLPQIPACPCCMSENEMGKLHSSKLRDLTADDLPELA